MDCQDLINAYEQFQWILFSDLSGPFMTGFIVSSGVEIHLFISVPRNVSGVGHININNE